MKNLILLSLSLLSFNAFASEANNSTIRYKCKYDITYASGENSKKLFSMVGIVELSNESGNDEAYLTLEPPISTGLNISARILLTRFDDGDYFPMTLHPRGDTATYLAHTDLKDHEQMTITHVNKIQTEYSLTCTKD